MPKIHCAPNSCSIGKKHRKTAKFSANMKEITCWNCIRMNINHPALSHVNGAIVTK